MNCTRFIARITSITGIVVLSSVGLLGSRRLPEANMNRIMWRPRHKEWVWA